MVSTISHFHASFTDLASYTLQIKVDPKTLHLSMLFKNILVGERKHAKTCLGPHGVTVFPFTLV